MRLPDTIDRIRQSVVQIRRVTPGAAPSGDIIGTGFIVTDDHHVVTAKHVVDGLGPGQVLQVFFAGPDIDDPAMRIRAAFTGLGGVVVDVDATHDLALIAVPGAAMLANTRYGPHGAQVHHAPVRLDQRKMREGVELAVSGYPLAQPSLVTNAGVLATTFSPDGAPGDYRDRYLGDFTANPGNSGGPVYTVSDASVVGVCVAGRLTNIVGGAGQHFAGLTVIVPVSEVRALIERNGLAVPDEAPAPRRDAKRSRNAKRR